MSKHSVGDGMNRRRFLKRVTASVAGAITAPAIVQAQTLGGGGGVAPGDRLTLGLIGMGRIMESHFRFCTASSDVQIAALCDVESRRLDKYQSLANEIYGDRYGKGSYDGVAVYKDFRELLARPDIDAVIAGVPDHWHALVAIDAARQGKDIYSEKPLSLTIYEGKRMVEAVRRYGRVFQTGSQQRSSREFLTACQIVRNGRIGKVHTVHANVGGPSIPCYLPEEPVPEGLDWERWLGPAPRRPFNAILAPPIEFRGWPQWRAYRDYSGGGMTDWGAHHFDIAQWGLGMDDTGPVAIIPPDGGEHKLLTYQYANGVTMYHGGATGRAGVEFIGTEGRVMVNRGYIETDPPGLLDEPFGASDLHLYESTSHHRNWLECIRTRRRPICDVAIGYRSVTVCHLGNIAYWLRRPLQWDPDAECFVNDAEANRMLSRSMRGPWQV